MPEPRPDARPVTRVDVEPGSRPDAGLGVQLGSLQWPVLPPDPMVVIPLGSCEQHGPHLPVDTDTRIAVALADGLAASRDDMLVAPAVAYGASWEHAGFPGLLSLDHQALAAMLIQLGHSATWARGLVFVNGHGGNVRAVRAAEERLLADGRAVLAWSPTLPDGDLHAGRVETSLMLALAPGFVAMERAEPGFMGRPSQSVFTDGVQSISQNGVLGDPTGATAEEGRSLLASLTSSLAAAVDAWVILQLDARQPPLPRMAADGP